jgi:D-glycero-alpha-D-manno-heptose-7-phosphate kinase
MIISQTPVRVSFFGGGTDFPEYFNRYGGAVLSTAIDKFVYLSVNYLSNFFDYRIKVSYSKTELVNDIKDIEHPAVRACLEHLGITSNIEINYFSNLPARTGLGTSSSFVVGLLHALYAYQGRMVSARRLAEEAVYVERVLIPENVGYQDQYAAAFGGVNYISFQDRDEARVEKVICTQRSLRTLQDNLLLFYTGIQRYSDTIQKKHVSDIDKNLESLDALTGLADRGRDILCGSIDDLEQFGRLLDEGWQLKKNIGRGVSNPEIDGMYSRAVKAGALGGKLLGAGGGGFLLLYVTPERQSSVRSALSELLEVSFSFEDNGSHIIFYDPEKLGNPGGQ